MGILSTILTFPAGTALGGVTWLGRKIAEAVEAELFDPGRIEIALLKLEKQLDAGEIDLDAFEAEETRLLAELREIRAMRGL